SSAAILGTVRTTDAELYSASPLPIGQYEITFELQGFQSVTLRNIALHVNDRLQLDGHLTLGAVAETIDVTAGRTLVQPIAALQSTMTSTQVKELPLNNRNFVQLATLAPGVSSDLTDEVGVGLTSTVSVSINGARRNGFLRGGRPNLAGDPAAGQQTAHPFWVQPGRVCAGGRRGLRQADTVGQILAPRA